MQSLTRAFQSPEPRLLNLFHRDLLQYQRERTEGTHTVCAGGGERDVEKTGIVVVAHKLGGAVTVLPPPRQKYHVHEKHDALKPL